MIQIPNYTIEKKLDQGGTSIVYLAVQDMLRRHVALKVMRPNIAQDSNFKESFLSEGAIVAHLEHPNIVRVYDIGVVDNSTFYMAMEYLGGGTLKKQLQQSKLTYSKAVKILDEISQGLVYAHIKGYIHRDIKPGNILFRSDGTAVLTDFGIAKRQDTSGELTQLGFTKGTVQYMSPEQVTTTDLDQRSDVYSLGLVFYEMLTGLKAFLAESTIQAIHQHTTVPPPTLPKEYAFLQEVFDKVLAKAPEDRFQSVDTFVYAVKATNNPDKTIVHRVGENYPNLDDDTQIYQPPLNTAVTSKKNRFSLVAGLVGGLVLAALLGYGAINYLGVVVSNDPDKNLPNKVLLADEVTQPEQDNTTNNQAILEANNKSTQQAAEVALAKQQADDAAKAALAKQQADDAAKAALAKQRADDAAKAVKQPGIVRVRASAGRKTVTALLSVIKANERVSINDNKSPATLRLPAGKYNISAKYEGNVLNKIVTIKAGGDITERFKFAANNTNNTNDAISNIISAVISPQTPVISSGSLPRPARPNSRQPARPQAIVARGTGRINLSTSLNGKAFPTSYIITQGGRRIRAVSGKSSASFTLPLGKYIVSAYYGGRPYPQHFEIEEGDIINLPIKFSH